MCLALWSDITAWAGSNAEVCITVRLNIDNRARNVLYYLWAEQVQYLAFDFSTQ